LEKSDALDAMDTFYQQAYDLISSPKAKEAFALEKEPEVMREAYGKNQAGQRLLMARRMVEAGVRYVSVTYGGWDMHNQIAGGMRRDVPPLDQALATLIEDLDSRGLLSKTLVMVSSEFGRTPKINNDAGRDHWPKVFSIALAGGGMKRGYVHGSSDATGGEPDNDPLTVEDYAATIFNQIGIDPAKTLITPGGRPQAIVKDGHVVKELLA
jgi:uncharacterized protein (DUF1501 family)